MILQSWKISLDTETANIKALKEEMQALRDGWESLLSEATLIAIQMHVAPQFSKEHSHQRKRKRFHEETSQEETAQDSAATVFRNIVFFTVMNNILSDHTTAKNVEELLIVLKVVLCSIHLSLNPDQSPSPCR